MRVLYATAHPPFPAHLGDQLISYEQVTRLGARVELHLLSLIEPTEDIGRVHDGLRPYCASVRLISHAVQIRQAWRSLYTGRPILVNLFYDPRVQRAVNDAVASIVPQVLHVQTIHMAEYFKDLPYPKVLDMIDSMSANMASRARRSPFPRHLLYRWEAARLRRYETATLPRFDDVLLVSAHDAATYAGFRCTVNPNGTAVTAERIAAWGHAGREMALLFHGNMDYFANVDAVRWFCGAVWPALAAQYPQLKLYIVGRNPAVAVRALHDGERVVVTSAVPDATEYLARCSVGVYPLATGSGMANKVLEALAAGLPAVVSPLAVQGIPQVRDGEHLLVAQSPREWVDKIGRFLSDPDFRAACAARGQALVLAHYSWARNAATVEARWRAAAERGAARPAA